MFLNLANSGSVQIEHREHYHRVAPLVANFSFLFSPLVDPSCLLKFASNYTHRNSTYETEYAYCVASKSFGKRSQRTRRISPHRATLALCVRQGRAELGALTKGMAIPQLGQGTVNEQSLTMGNAITRPSTRGNCHSNFSQPTPCELIKRGALGECGMDSASELKVHE